MRRLTAVAAVSVLVPVGAVATLGGPAAAQPSPTPPPTGAADDESQIYVPEPVAGEQRCAIEDLRLRQLSGLAATDDGYYAINDGSGEQGVFVLDQSCQVTEHIFYPAPGSRDPEDLALDRGEDILWVGDLGDNQAAGTAEGEPRQTVALWRVDLGGDRVPVIHRFAYEDGQARDAEALILDGDGTPIIVTKSPTGPAELFRATDLVPNNPHEQAVPLERVGEFDPPATGTEHELFPAAAAGAVVTGGATGPDAETVVLRTYTDAFEFDVADGDVAAAITDTEPRVTPLPEEPLGESITYPPDGGQFLTVSEAPEGDDAFTPAILGYEPAPPPPEPEEEPGSDDPAGAADDGGGWSLVNDVQDIINLIAAVGVLGLLLVGAGVFGIVRSRRRAREESAGDPGDDDASRPVTGRARLTGDGAGREQAAAAEPAAGVYTSNAARPAPEPGGHHPGEYGREYRAGEYGGGEYGAGEYGRDAYDGRYEASPYEHPGRGYGGHEYGGGHHGGGHPEPGYGAADRYGEYGDYGGYQPDHPPADHGGGVYGGAPAGEYGGYPGDPYSGYDYQEDGYADPRAHPDYGYRDGYQDWPPEPGYGHPQDAGHRGEGHPTYGPDYYSDDPDYPYEFRDPNRW